MKVGIDKSKSEFFLMLLTSFGTIVFFFITYWKIEAAFNSYSFMTLILMITVLPLCLVYTLVVSILYHRAMSDEVYRKVLPFILTIGAFALCIVGLGIIAAAILLCATWVPYMKTKPDDIVSRLRKNVLLVIICLFTLVLLATFPRNWFEIMLEKIPKKTLTQQEQQELYEEGSRKQEERYEKFWQSLLRVQVDEASDENKIMSIKSEIWTPLPEGKNLKEYRTYTFSKNLCDSISAVLKEAPTEYFDDSDWLPSVDGITLEIWLDGYGAVDYQVVTFYYSPFDNIPQMGAAGKAIMRIFRRDDGESVYSMIDNKYVDEIFEMLEEYEKEKW